MAKPKPTKMLAVLGRSRRTGRWRVASRSSVLSLLGACHLDMTQSFVDDKEKLKMTVQVFLGSATFILPDGAEVRPSGTAVLAASMVDVPDHDDTSDLPTLDIEWTCIFGRIRILSEDAAAQLEAEQQQKRLEKAIKKGKASPEIIEVSEAAPATKAEAPAVEAPAAAAAEPSPATPSAAEPEPEPEPVVAGVGFDDLPAAEPEPEPVVAGVGFDDLPAAEPEPVAAAESESESEPEPVVTGVGFDDLPAAEPEPEPVAAVEPEPVVTGVGFDDLPAAEPEPVVTGVGFDDLPAADTAEETADDSGDAAVAEPADATGDSDDADESDGAEQGRPSADVGFIDMEYDPEAANAAV
ncbi:MAG: hypothetical protein AAGA65_05845 [Actinomycetota bacterium]